MLLLLPPPPEEELVDLEVVEELFFLLEEDFPPMPRDLSETLLYSGVPAVGNAFRDLPFSARSMNPRNTLAAVRPGVMVRSWRVPIQIATAY